jgi:hypothetical protein
MRVKPHLRRAIAYVAQRVASGDEARTVYDYDAARHIAFTGDVSKKHVDVYDYDRGAYVGGDLPSLYDYGDGHFVGLDVTNNEFSGYDFGSGAHYNGTVKGDAVSLYDYETGQFHAYRVN